MPSGLNATPRTGLASFKAAVSKRVGRALWQRNYFEHIADTNPVRRIGTPVDIAGAVLFAMTNTFMTGMTLKVDGGEPLV